MKYLIKLTIAFSLIALAVSVAGSGPSQDGNFKVELPAPTGKYSVGRTSFYWVDASRGDRPKQGTPNLPEVFGRFYHERVDWRAGDASFALTQLEKLNAGKAAGMSKRNDL